MGDQLEKAGWRQGSIVQQGDTAGIFALANHAYENKLSLIVATQSCDIANNNTESDPCIELSIARSIEKLDGNLTFNKNPRILHTTLQVYTEDVKIANQRHIELKAFEKLSLPKNHFCDLAPDQNSLLKAANLEAYVAWLAARYFRPALPTEFNNRIAAVDRKNKLRKKAKDNNQQLSGIYVEIIPDAEIPEDQKYRVNLLGLVSAGTEGNLDKVEAALDEYAEIMRRANMEVMIAVRKEDEISLATFRRFKRFYYDDLSFKNSDPLPPEVRNIL